MPKVVVYCRVSSEEQAQKDLSIPAQRKAIHRYVAEQGLGWEILTEFLDEGHSAYAPVEKRPGFCAMMTFCKKNDVDYILVHKFCRFSRYREESVLFKSMLRRRGIQVRSVTEPLDPETKEGFLYEGIIEIINQFQSMNLSSEVLKGMRENAERGFANGGKAPFGYKKVKIVDPRGQEHMVYDLGDDDEIETVREIFDMAVNQGMGAKAIANALNSRKVRGPAGRDWQAPTVWFLLSNQVYVGDLVWYKSKRVGRDGRARTDDEERVVFPNAHPAIIDRETFERRKALAAPRAFEERKSRAQRVNYLLARLIRCAHCGATYCGRRQRYKGKGGEPTDRVAYYCGGYLNKGPAACRSRPLPQPWLEGQVMAAIRARLGDEEKQAELRARLQARIDEQRRRYTFDSKTIKQKLAAIDQQVSRYFALIGEGWEVDRARAAIDDLKAKKARLEEEIVQVQQEEFHQKALHKNLELLERLSRILVHEFETVSFGVQRQVIAAFVDEIEVVDHERLVMRLVVPFDNGGLQLLVEQAEAAMRGDLIEDAENNEGESGLTRSSPSFYERPSEVPRRGPRKERSVSPP